MDADRRGTREVHGKMNLGKRLPFQWIRLVGAVGIENTTERNFKELEGMLGNLRALKRNNRESKGILIGPSMAPRFSRW
jgi:hypothetical protein